MNSEQRPSLYQLDDWIMQACFEIKEKRPCVDFNRTYWIKQFECIKNFLIDIDRMNDNNLIDSSLLTSQTLDDQRYNRVRLEAQYELYRYRKHLQSTEKQYALRDSRCKIAPINQLIRSTQIHSNTDTLNDVKHNFSTTITDQSFSLSQSRQHKNIGYAFLSVLRQVLWYLFTMSACPSKGKRLIRSLKRRQRSSAMLPSLCTFFGLPPSLQPSTYSDANSNPASVSL